MSFPSSLPYRVLSGRPSDLESGFTPFHEASFATEDEAKSFIDEWNRLYSDCEIEFFLDI